MREKWARRIAFLTALMVILLAVIFATVQNPSKPTYGIKSREQIPTAELTQSVTLEPKRIETGRQIYKQQACANCHSIAGQGNPRNPLDSVGTKRSADELRDVIIGADVLQGALPESVRKLKQRYRKLSDDELNALVVYMLSLRN